MAARYVVIMAGGAGTRFWPKSRKTLPKQFLAIGGGRSLLRQTFERVEPLVGAENVLVVTGEVHADHARDELPEVPPANVLVEPVGRNTAPCIGLATHHLAAKDPDAEIAVLPADHFVADAERFRAALSAAFEAASAGITLIGIVPTRPETGFGYIKAGPKVRTLDGHELRVVLRFVEKPSRAVAEGYLAEGGYLWNGGMFVYRAGDMLGALAAHAPALAAGLLRLADDPALMADLYPTLPAISIDVAVMEKAAGIHVVPVSFGWSDVGYWDSAYELGDPDADGNVLLGDGLAVATRRSLVDARAGRMVALLGVEDLVVVDTEDALLVARRGETQEVRQIVSALERLGRTELL